jgi:hypothetical protein
MITIDVCDRASCSQTLEHGVAPSAVTDLQRLNNLKVQVDIDPIIYRQHSTAQSQQSVCTTAIQIDRRSTLFFAFFFCRFFNALKTKSKQKS